MPEFLIVPAGKAATFTGSYCDGMKALEPRPLKDGRAILPASLLSNEEAQYAFPGIPDLLLEEISPDRFSEE